MVPDRRLGGICLPTPVRPPESLCLPFILSDPVSYQPSADVNHHFSDSGLLIATFEEFPDHLSLLVVEPLLKLLTQPRVRKFHQSLGRTRFHAEHFHAI